MTKDNANTVDNMILPQLKAMSATYREHKGKYKRLKQAGWVLGERIARRGGQWEERERLERQRMQDLEENARQIEREYLRVV